MFLCDLDETLIVFNHLLMGEYSKATKQDPAIEKKMGEFLESLIFELADEKFFFREVQVLPLLLPLSLI